MRVYFSFDYKEGNAYLGMKDHPMMMDTLVTDVNGLLGFLELRLGLHAVPVSDADRLVTYYKCVREFMRLHEKDVDNQLFDSYNVSPLATSREMLKWRDALAVCGWTKNTPAPSRRLKVLKGVEELFEPLNKVDFSIRQKAIADRLRQKLGMMKDVTFVMPFNPDWLHPALKEIFSLAVEDGADIEQIKTPPIQGDDNLSRLKRILTSDVQKMQFDENDPSVRIWKFRDSMEAEEYAATLDDGTFDVTVQPDAKLTDNFLRMMGKPVAGSSVSNSAPQIIQMFFTGVGILERPLNISVLLQWLYAPTHPLPAYFRYRLAERLANSGGWYDMADDRDVMTCRQLVEDWTNGKAEEEKGSPIDKKEKAARRLKAEIFLPGFEHDEDECLTAGRLHTFLTELGAWSRQRSAMIMQEDAGDMRVSQLVKLAELCDTLQKLTDDRQADDIILFSEIEKHISCLYEASEFQQYKAQASSRFIVAKPGQVASKAENVLWTGMNNYEVDSPATDFLTPAETDVLKDHLKLWNKDDVRKIQQQTLILPILFCQGQLTLSTVEMTGDEKAVKHPLIVRIEQQMTNHNAVTTSPKFGEGQYVPVLPLSNSADNPCYVNISRTDLIRWKKHESPTSIEKLIQNPIDYALDSIAYISDNGQSALSNIAMTKGNVAHAVIQHLFYIQGDKNSGYADAIRERVEKFYEKTFDDVVRTKGAVLLLQENTIERRQLFNQLRECIDHLIDIIDKNRLHVTACELSLKGYTLGEVDEQTPDMLGFADMVLAKEDGQHVIFDFKWTSSRHYYQGLLQQNRSSQLAIYADMLRELTDDRTLPTAYFLMPQGKLFSTFDFKGNFTTQIEVDEGSEGHIIPKITAAYHYRRQEIMEGQIETGEAQPLEQLQYFNDTESGNLFPLKPEYGNDAVKAVNNYSNFNQLKD